MAGNDLLEYCRQLPKVELHAHLNGSISARTMEVLLERRSKKLSSSVGTNSAVPELQQIVIRDGEQRKLDSAFEVFKLIHSVVDDEEAISLAACDVVKEFYEDNVKYLELRTTPRSNLETGMTKDSYIQAVLNGIKKGVSEVPSEEITVRLLLSVDRRQEMSDAYDTLRLAHQFYLLDNVEQGRVVGLDLSGYPKAGNTKNLVILLNEAKKYGLKLSIHMAERADCEEDSQGLLSVDVDRIGHATFLHRGPLGPDSPLVRDVLDRKIPIELCITSNIKAQTVKTYDQHQFKFWKDRQHPLVLCTDDKGVFSTNLSDEYHIVAKTFGLTQQDMYQLVRDSTDHIFDTTSNCKAHLSSFFK